MRLDKAQDLLKRHSCEFSYTEEDGLGSIVSSTGASATTSGNSPTEKKKV